jgi:hypothetical protein
MRTLTRGTIAELRPAHRHLGATLHIPIGFCLLRRLGETESPSLNNFAQR